MVREIKQTKGNLSYRVFKEGLSDTVISERSLREVRE